MYNYFWMIDSFSFLNIDKCGNHHHENDWYQSMFKEGRGVPRSMDNRLTYDQTEAVTKAPECDYEPIYETKTTISFSHVTHYNWDHHIIYSIPSSIQDLSGYQCVIIIPKLDHDRNEGAAE